MDHPNKVERLAVFDVIPILEGWNRSDARFAQTYWPWVLLSQKAPLPESEIESFGTPIVKKVGAMAAADQTCWGCRTRIGRKAV